MCIYLTKSDLVIVIEDSYFPCIDTFDTSSKCILIAITYSKKFSLLICTNEDGDGDIVLFLLTLSICRRLMTYISDCVTYISDCDVLFAP